MRTIPYSFAKQPEQPAATEPAASTPAPETPATPAQPKAPEKTFLQKYGIWLGLVLAIAAIYFFMKYKIVAKVAAVAAV